MQHRQPGLGDILDDYCPRERRITNHAVVAMVGPDVKQTRCTTCDAEHEYKHARVPSARRKKESAPALFKQVLDSAQPEAMRVAEPALQPGAPPQQDPEPVLPAVAQPELDPEPQAEGPIDESREEERAEGADEDGPVHRRLIRATLPRQEGQVSQRPLPQFTVRQPNFGNGNMRGGRGPGSAGSGGRARPANVRGSFGRASRPESFHGRSGLSHQPPRGSHHQGGRGPHHSGGRSLRHGKKSSK